MKLNTTILESRGRVNQIYLFPAFKKIRKRCHWELALTPNSLSHIFNSLKNDSYRDLEALETTRNFVILCRSSNHFGIPKGIYRTVRNALERSSLGHRVIKEGISHV
jgi:hypothetical protein